MFARPMILVSFVALVSATGAMSQPATSPQPDKTSPIYRQAFSEGCEHATFGNPRNEARFNSDPSYHDGWLAGFRNCYSHNTINTNNDPNGPLKGLF